MLQVFYNTRPIRGLLCRKTWTAQKVIAVFSDDQSNARRQTHALQRPQFKALLSQIRNGETLVVAKLDRLGRDAQDVGATIKALAKRKIEVIVLQLGKLDLTSSAGKLMLNMLAAVAEMERDLLIERTKSGITRAKNEGKILGRPAKTTEQQRSEIKNMRKNGVSVSALSRTFGISRASIMRITSDV